MNEDQLTAALIEMERGNNIDDLDITIQPEVGYNDYGDRGVVDLYSSKGVEDRIYEVKSDHAVMSSTGANEIIRQFTRHCNHFYQGSSNTSYGSNVTFELTFVPSRITARHVAENIDLYVEAVKNLPHRDLRASSTKVVLNFRHPENIIPVLVAVNGHDYTTGTGKGDTFEEYAKHVNPLVFDAIEDSPLFSLAD